MAYRFGEIAFTPRARTLQQQHGSRAAYQRREEAPEVHGETLGPRETEFIGACDGFFLASVGETGWPYVQHRGGRPGFLKVLDPRTLGFADLAGNRQFVSTANLQHDARVALILMDWARRRRMKIFGHATIADPAQARDLAARLVDPDDPGLVERLVTLHVAAFDWNCSQHIVQRFTVEEFQELVARPLDENGPSVLPFTLETAQHKVQLAQDAWNSRDPERIALAYTPDSHWRNRDEFFSGRDAIRAFLRRKFARELDYRLEKELWAFTGSRISVRFEYEWHDATGQWWRSHGNEHWDFDASGLIARRDASINDVPIAQTERRLR